MTYSAYRLTSKDIKTVLCHQWQFLPTGTPDDVDGLAEILMAEVDAYEAEDAALCGADPDEQADFARENIAQQLRRLGILSNTRDGFEDHAGKAT